MQTKAITLTAVASALLLGSALTVQARGRQPEDTTTTTTTATTDTRYEVDQSTKPVQGTSDSGLYRGNPGPSGAGTTQSSGGGAY